MRIRSGFCGCGKKSSSGGYYCLPHKAEYMRKWRKKRGGNKALTSIQRLKMNARSYVHVYLKRGKIARGKCEVCAEPKTQPHHEDYNRPLKVRWLCRKHHLELHRNER